MQGMAVGLAIAAPVGPVSMLCFRRTLQAGAGAGLSAGLGAAVGDAICAAMAAFGLGQLGRALLAHHVGLRVTAGAVLCALGAASLGRDASSVPTAWARLADRLGGFGTTLVLTVSNPLNLGALIGILALTGIGAMPVRERVLVVLGVLTGALVWWAWVAGVADLARHRLGLRAHAWMQKMTGAGLFIAGVVVLVSIAVRR